MPPECAFSTGAIRSDSPKAPRTSSGSLRGLAKPSRSHKRYSRLQVAAIGIHVPFAQVSGLPRDSPDSRISRDGWIRYRAFSRPADGVGRRRGGRRGRSCDCRGLRVEGDLVRGLEQVLPDRRHRRLGVGLVHLEIPCAVRAEEPFHDPCAPVDPDPARRGPPGIRWPAPGAVAMTGTRSCAAGLSSHAPRSCPDLVGVERLLAVGRHDFVCNPLEVRRFRFHGPMPGS